MHSFEPDWPKPFIMLPEECANCSLSLNSSVSVEIISVPKATNEIDFA